MRQTFPVGLIFSPDFMKLLGCPYSVDEVLKIVETVVTIEIARIENNDTITKTLCLTKEEGQYFTSSK